MAIDRQVGQALQELCAFCDKQGWQFCLVGGLAAGYWGEPRFIKDVDFVVLTGFGNESDFINSLIREFEMRMPDAADFPRRSRVLILKSGEGVRLDVSFGAIKFEESMISRAKRRTIVRGVKVSTASPEDIIVMKAIAGRPQDIEGIVATQGKKLDIAYVRHWLGTLIELIPETDLLERSNEILRSVESRMQSAAIPMKASLPKRRDHMAE